MAIKEQLRTDMADAMRTGDKEKRDTLRLLLAAIKQVEVDGRTTLDDADVQIILTKQAKQRRESIAEYEAAGRQEQADHEEAELDIIESYLPQMMSRQEVEEIAAQTIADLGADSPKDMGRVMGRLMPQVKGRANGSLVSDVVRDIGIK